MRIGLLSDCEGDVAALEAALAAIRSHAPDVVVHAGDILCCPFSPNTPDAPSSRVFACRLRDGSTRPAARDSLMQPVPGARRLCLG